jgi:polygalacturonase
MGRRNGPFGIKEFSAERTVASPAACACCNRGRAPGAELSVDAHETARRRFLGKAAGAAAVSAAVIGGAELAGASPAAAQTTTVPGFYDVTAYGALGNGSHDDTPAIQNAINAAAANEYGGVVFLPIGQYAVTT